ncbi:ABC transporter substrate-binding protein [Neobacillus sp. 19]|uniref:ABC transporter substrate-binding protein n=1 Tax=Neobacillus sp. 19 TaxID=3394458 RepID=UPI003BF6324B
MVPKKVGKQMKWFTCIFVILMLMAGCAKDQQPKDSGEAAPAKKEVKTIHFLAHSNYEAPLKKVIEEFEKENPDIKVEMELAPFSQLMESIEIKLGSKASDTDLIFVDSPLVVNYSVKGYLEPLDKLLESESKKKWVKSALDTVTYKNQIMAAPMNNSSQVLFYNKDILTEKGIPLPKEDERLTWEEVIEKAKQLTYNDGQQQVFGFSLDRVDTSFQFLPLAQGLGASMLSEDGLTTEGFTNSPKAMKAFTFYSDLYNKWKVSPKINQEESLDYFISGKVAMFLGLSHNLPKLVDSKLNFGVTLFPYFKDGEVATPTGSWNIGISKFSKNKKEAAKFLEYLTVGKGAETMFEVGGTLPVHIDLLDKIFKDPMYNEFPKIVIKMSAEESRTTATPRPKTPGYLEWDTNVSKALKEIKNGTDPEAALDETVRIIDNLLKKYKGL